MVKRRLEPKGCKEPEEDQMVWGERGGFDLPIWNTKPVTLETKVLSNRPDAAMILTAAVFSNPVARSELKAV